MGSNERRSPTQHPTNPCLHHASLRGRLEGACAATDSACLEAMSARAAISRSTVAVWPFAAAMWRGVDPFCRARGR